VSRPNDSNTARAPAMGKGSSGAGRATLETESDEARSAFAFSRLSMARQNDKIACDWLRPVECVVKAAISQKCVREKASCTKTDRWIGPGTAGTSALLRESKEGAERAHCLASAPDASASTSCSDFCFFAFRAEQIKKLPVANTSLIDSDHESRRCNIIHFAD
jgi:hypothetical protein